MKTAKNPPFNETKLRFAHAGLKLIRKLLAEALKVVDNIVEHLDPEWEEPNQETKQAGAQTKKS